MNTHPIKYQTTREISQEEMDELIRKGILDERVSLKKVRTPYYLKIDSSMKTGRFAYEEDNNFIAAIENYLNKYKIEYDYDVFKKDITAYVNKIDALRIGLYFKFEELDYFNGTVNEKLIARQEQRGRKYVATDPLTGKELTKRGFAKMIRENKEKSKEDAYGLTKDERRDLLELNNILGRIYKKITSKGFVIRDGRIVLPEINKQKKNVRLF